MILRITWNKFQACNILFQQLFEKQASFFQKTSKK